MEADKNEFNNYRQPSLSDTITVPPTVLQNAHRSSHRNSSAIRGKAGVRANNHHSIVLHRVEQQLPAK